MCREDACGLGEAWEKGQWADYRGRDAHSKGDTGKETSGVRGVECRGECVGKDAWCGVKYGEGHVKRGSTGERVVTEMQRTEYEEQGKHGERAKEKGIQYEGA